MMSSQTTPPRTPNKFPPKFLHCEYEVTKVCSQWHPIQSLQVMGQYGNVECKLATCVQHNAAKHGCDNHDAVDRIEIRLETRRHTLHSCTVVVEGTLRNSPVFYVVSRVAETMVAKITVHGSENVVEIFLQTVSCKRSHFLCQGSWRGCTIH